MLLWKVLLHKVLLQLDFLLVLGTSIFWFAIILVSFWLTYKKVSIPFNRVFLFSVLVLTFSLITRSIYPSDIQTRIQSVNENDLVVMTMNLRGAGLDDVEGKNSWHMYRKYDTIDIWNKYKPMIVGTQEGSVEMLAYLSRSSGLNWIGKMASDRSAIFYNPNELELIDYEMIPLSPRRTASYAIFKKQIRESGLVQTSSILISKYILYFNTHLDYIHESVRLNEVKSLTVNIHRILTTLAISCQEARTTQANEKMTDQWKCIDIIISGDFNSLRHGKVWHHLMNMNNENFNISGRNYSLQLFDTLHETQRLTHQHPQSTGEADTHISLVSTHFSFHGWWGTLLETPLIWIPISVACTLLQAIPSLDSLCVPFTSNFQIDWMFAGKFNNQFEDTRSYDDNRCLDNFKYLKKASSSPSPSLKLLSHIVVTDHSDRERREKATKPSSIKHSIISSPFYPSDHYPLFVKFRYS